MKRIVLQAAAGAGDDNVVDCVNVSVVEGLAVVVIFAVVSLETVVVDASTVIDVVT